MGIALLDVNLLLALAWPNHVHHDAAHKWFERQRSQKWATCSATQAGFLRLSAHPAVTKSAVSVGEALHVLEANTAAPEHVFWVQQRQFRELLPEIRTRLVGHQQVSDALLLDLAIQNRGVLATFDQAARSLLSSNSEHRASIEIVPL